MELMFIELPYPFLEDSFWVRYTMILYSSSSEETKKTRCTSYCCMSPQNKTKQEQKREKLPKQNKKKGYGKEDLIKQHKRFTETDITCCEKDNEKNRVRGVLS